MPAPRRQAHPGYRPQGRTRGDPCKVRAQSAVQTGCPRLTAPSASPPNPTTAVSPADTGPPDATTEPSRTRAEPFQASVTLWPLPAGTTTCHVETGTAADTVNSAR